MEDKLTVLIILAAHISANAKPHEYFSSLSTPTCVLSCVPQFFQLHQLTGAYRLLTFIYLFVSISSMFLSREPQTKVGLDASVIPESVSRLHT